MENMRINDERLRKIISLERDIDKMSKKLNVLRKDYYYSEIDTNLCKGHVHYSFTYEERDFQWYLSKNFKMKGKYVLSFLALINGGNRRFGDLEYFVMPPENYTYHLNDDNDYLVSSDYYGFECVNVNLFNLSKDRLNRNRERRGLNYEK